MRKLSHCLCAVFLLALFCCAIAPSNAQLPGNTAATDISTVEPSMLLLQSNIGDDLVTGTAFVVKSGDSCLAVTSYEAVMGASVIKAMVPGEGLVNAHLVKYAQEINMALLEIPAPNIPAVKIGDFESIRPRTLLTLICKTPIMDGTEASGSSTTVRNGTLQNTITRPNGAIMRVTFNPGIDDATTGAPVMLPSSGEVVGISLSMELSQVDSLRFTVPARYVYALCPELSNGADVPAFVKVKDGSEAPVKKSTDKNKNKNGYGTGVYATVVAIALAIIITVYFLTRKKKVKVVPFSTLPILPEGVEMAFITEDGKILPDADIIKVGRAEGNVWQFTDPTVSNNHARIRRNKTTKQYEVEDLRSSNGTFVGKRRIVSAETIAPGTIVRFGKKVKVMLMLRTQAADPLAQLGLKRK